MKIVNLSTALVFACLIAAPIASAVVAPAKEKGEKPISLRSVLLSEPYRDGLIQALILDSPVGKASLRAKSHIDYDVFGFVHAGKVISGADDWLFYKGDFKPCLPDDQIRDALDTIDVTQVLAEAIGIDFRVAVAPNKSIVYPNKLGLRAGQLARCSLQNAENWRLIAGKPAWLIDHLDAIRSTSKLTYFHTDTHWNDVGFSLAFRQLVTAYLGRSLPNVPEARLDEMSKSTDLMEMIGSTRREPSTEGTRFQLLEWPKTLRAGVAGRTVILHDSFYAGHKPLLTKLFPKAAFAHAASNGDAVGKLMAPLPSTVLVEAVERNWMGRIKRVIALDGTAGSVILRANRAAASLCRFSDGADAVALDGKTSEVPLSAGEGSVCPRLNGSPERSIALTILLPDLARTPPAYRALRNIPVVVPRSGTASLILPARYRGFALRIKGPSGMRDVSAETGSAMPGS